MSVNIPKATYRADHALTEEQAQDYWNLIFLHGGAHPNDQPAFVRYMMMASQFPKEYRFQGRLGWGGKAHFDGKRAYVSCYTEDDTPERDLIKKLLNEELRGLLDA